MELEGKVAIVTGAGKGIGRAIAGAYAIEGAKLVLVSRTLEEVQDAGEEISRFGIEPLPLSIDVSKPEQVDTMLASSINKFGSIDILVNNAAVLGPVGPFIQNDMAKWAETVNINVTGLALCCKAVLPLMIKQNAGKIINLSGAGVNRSSPTLSAYGVSKAAVVRFTETLSIELEGTNVTANALGPGQIDTQLLDPIVDAGSDLVEPLMYNMVRNTKSGGGASIENAAALAVWLGSERSDGLNGRMISATQAEWLNKSIDISEIMSSDLYSLRFNS